MIPVYRRPHEDEHIYGWLAELSRMNGMDFRQFVETYAGGQDWEGVPDSVSGIISLSEYEDPVKLLYGNTLLPALFPFMTVEQQASSLYHLLCGGRGHVYHTSARMKACPACMREDASKGLVPYYRVWHQLDGVQTCAVHGVPLITMKRNGALGDEKVMKSAVRGGKEAYDIADKVLSLYKDPVSTCYENWRCRLPKNKRHRNRAMLVDGSDEGWLREAEKTEVVGDIPCCICGKDFPGHPYIKGRYNICHACLKRLGQERAEGAALAMRTDYRVENGAIVHIPCGRAVRKRMSREVFIWSGIECSCLKKKGSLKIHKKSLDDDEFTVVDYFKVEGRPGRRVRIRHSTCGGEFDIKPADFANRRFCRVCGYDAYGFKDRVMRMTGDEYAVLNSPSSLAGSESSVEFLHKPCGTRFSNRAKNFLAGQRCPFCTARIGPEKVMELLRENCDLEGYGLRKKGGCIEVTFPDGEKKTIRGALAMQDLTRLDRPELFRRLKRIAPPVGGPAKVYFYYREHCGGDGVFTSKDGPELTGVKDTAFFSDLEYLCKRGLISRVRRGVYRIEGQ